MSDWKEYKLDELVEITSSKRIMRSEYQENGIPFFRSKEIIELNSGNEITTELFISKERFLEIKNKFGTPSYGDILLTSVGTLGVPYFVNYKEEFYFKDGNLTWFRKFNNILRSKYLYYWFSSSVGRKALKEITIGSTQPALTITGLKSLTIHLPTLEEQDYIIEILDHLSSKIHLNTQINQTLEQIAQALFKSWFVDFDPVHAKVQALSDGLTLEQVELAAMQAISGKTPEELTALSQTQPERYTELVETAKAFPCEMVEVDGVEVPKGWEQTTLSEICEMQNGYAFKSSEWTDAGIPVIKIGSIQSKILTVEGNGFVSEDNLSLRSNFALNGGDIVIGLTGAYVGKVGRMPANKKAMLNQRVAKFLAKRINESETFYSFIYMNMIQEDFKNFVDFTAQGSAQPNISTRDILKYPLLLANNDVHLAFEKLLKKILDKSIFNSYQNEILSNSRDLLLPRLLNGKL